MLIAARNYSFYEFVPSEIIAYETNAESFGV